MESFLERLDESELYEYQHSLIRVNIFETGGRLTSMYISDSEYISFRKKIEIDGCKVITVHAYNASTSNLSPEFTLMIMKDKIVSVEFHDMNNRHEYYGLFLNKYGVPCLGTHKNT